MPNGLAAGDGAKEQQQQRPRTPQSIDEHVGRRLRMRRIMEGVTQTALAGKVGVTFQQVQKYEAGRNRISAGHLYQFAQALNCTPTFFYDEFSENSVRRTTARQTELETFMRGGDAVRLCKTFLAIKDEDVRSAVLEFMGSLGAAPKTR
jgi:transcriptional regulator with XRE-family HTH domain